MNAKKSKADEAESASHPWEDLGLGHPAEGTTKANVLRQERMRSRQYHLSTWIQPYLKQTFSVAGSNPFLVVVSLNWVSATCICKRAII